MKVSEEEVILLRFSRCKGTEMPSVRAMGDEPAFWRASARPPAAAFVVVDVGATGSMPSVNGATAAGVSTDLSTTTSPSSGSRYTDDSISGIDRRGGGRGGEGRGEQQMRPEDFLGNLRQEMMYEDFSLRGYEMERSRAAYISRRSRQYDVDFSSSSASSSDSSSSDGDDQGLGAGPHGAARLSAHMSKQKQDRSKKKVDGDDEALVGEMGMVMMPLVTAMELKRGYRLAPSPDPAYLGFVPSARDGRPFLSAMPLVTPGRSVTSQEEAMCCSCYLPVSYVHRFALVTVLVVTMLAIAALFFFVIFGLYHTAPSPRPVTT